MGCASSKRVEAAVAADDYRPPPTSISLFDVNTIQEPWLITTITEEDPKRQQQEKKAITPLPLPLLEKIESYELSPHSWSEVSKALEDLKPSLHQPPPPPSNFANHPQLPPPSSDHEKPPQKISSSHTLEEVDAQLSSPTNKKNIPPSSPPRSRSPPRPSLPELAGFKPVKENSFIIRDRQERESKKASGDPAAARWRRREPLEGYPERCPPGNGDGVVLYTTTLRGVRRTFEDCERARRAVETHAVEAGVVVEERDVSLHGDYLKEVRELVGEGAAVPRLFIRGRYVGGVEEVVELGETGKLREMLRWVAARGERGRGGWRECEGCGGARFVPCLECNGSCKVVAEDGKGVLRCDKCNENGLMLCPLCH
ncbi:drebrin-like [Cocos nucifera]|uniref:Drebrin-like n=1 Tax=Cocos nucifera TaxID=13894 RepID=A0A8K0I378_COCNU|nr:drebrin-like [Cocos nucifera]